MYVDSIITPAKFSSYLSRLLNRLDPFSHIHIQCSDSTNYTITCSTINAINTFCVESYKINPVNPFNKLDYTYFVELEDKILDRIDDIFCDMDPSPIEMFLQDQRTGKIIKIYAIK